MKLRTLILVMTFTSSVSWGNSILDGLFGNSHENPGLFEAPAGQKSLWNASRWKATSPDEYTACRAEYDQMLADGILEVSLTFGYHDSPKRGLALDQSELASTMALLRRPCSSQTSPICGFVKISTPPENQFVLEKSLPDYEGIPRTHSRIRVTLTYSSAHQRDSQNLEQGIPSKEQVQYSELAEEQFFGSIAGIANVGPQKKCEVCAYFGHARNGGGPDFRPVPLAWRDRENEPNYDKYLANQTNYRRLLASLAEAGNEPPHLLAIMGCMSQSHFLNKKICAVEGPGCVKTSLSDYSATTGLFVSDLLSWPENREQYMGILFDGVLGLKCRSAWEANLKGLRQLSSPEGYQLIGNFLKSPASL